MSPRSLKTDFFNLKNKSYQLTNCSQNYHGVAIDNKSIRESEEKESGIAAPLLKRCVKLPTISLPNFSGAYEDWFPFYDTFNTLIHNNNEISDIQKFHYFKSCLKSEAANVLHSLEISANNYQSAWQMLEDRYNNKRSIIQRHIKAIFELPIAHKSCRTKTN